MKKIIFVVLSIALFAACSKKQDVKPPLTPQNATVKDLTGKWNLIADTVYTTTNGQTTKTVTSNLNSQIIFQFNADGTGSGNLSSVVDGFNYQLSSGTIVLTQVGTSNSAAQSISLTIVVITADKLALRSVATDESQVLSFIRAK